MIKLALKILKIVGIVFLVLIALIAVLLFWLSTRPFVPNDYIKTVDIGGELEAKYLAMGVYEVKYTEADAPEEWKKFEAYGGSMTPSAFKMATPSWQVLKLFSVPPAKPKRKP